MRFLKWPTIIIVLATIGVWVYFCTRTVEPDLVPGTLVTKSHEAILGAIGYKQQTQVGKETRWFFERMAVPAWKNLDVYLPGTVMRSESEVRGLEKLGLSAVSRAWLETSGRHEKSDTYKLVTLQIRDPEEIAHELLELSKANPYVRSILRQPGVRIVREVDQVFDHETTEKLQLTTRAGATLAKARDTDVQLSFGAERKTTVTISNGSVVAYRLALLCWKRDGTLQVRLDQGSPCPAGFQETLPDAVEIADAKPVNTTVRETQPATLAKPECPSIAGWWVRDMDGARLEIHQDGCMISADAPTGPFAHSFRGLYIDDHFQYVVKRTNNTGGCKTVMYGDIEVLEPDRIRVVVAATDGKCELARDFWEDLTWRREKAL